MLEKLFDKHPWTIWVLVSGVFVLCSWIESLI